MRVISALLGDTATAPTLAVRLYRSPLALPRHEGRTFDYPAVLVRPSHGPLAGQGGARVQSAPLRDRPTRPPRLRRRAAAGRAAPVGGAPPAHGGPAAAPAPHLGAAPAGRPHHALPAAASRARHELTPYLGYYYSVSALNWLLPLEVGQPRLPHRLRGGAAARRSPSCCAASGGPRGPRCWRCPSRTATASRGASSTTAPRCRWRFSAAASSCARSRTRPGAARGPRGLAACLVAVLLFHVQAFAFLALALPLAAAHDGRARGRAAEGLARAAAGPACPRCWACCPACALFLAWVGLRLGQPAGDRARRSRGRPGGRCSRRRTWPSSASSRTGPSSSQRARQHLPRRLGPLAACTPWALVAAVRAGAASRPAAPRAEGPVARFRLLGLGLLALALYFLLPFDIRGYIYYLNTRYAHLAAALLVASVPGGAPSLRRPLLWASAAVRLVLAVVLGRGFRAFSREASEWDALVAATAPRPRVMGLIFETARGGALPRLPPRRRGAGPRARRRHQLQLRPHAPLAPALRGRSAPPLSPPSGGRRSWTTQAQGRATTTSSCAAPPLARLRRPAPVGARSWWRRPREAGWCAAAERSSVGGRAGLTSLPTPAPPYSRRRAHAPAL